MSSKSNAKPRNICEILRDPGAAKHGQLRVVDESGDDYLYPESRFADCTSPISSQSGPRRWLSPGEPARGVVKRAPNEEAERESPSLLALKLRDEIGRTDI